MIEFIRSPQRIFLTVPSKLFMNKRFKWLLVEPISSDDGKIAADLSFQIYESSQSNSQNHLIKHKSSQRFYTLLCTMLIFMTYEEMDKYVKDFHCNDYDDYIT